MQLPKNFCIAPFFQHTTHPSGSCSPCPYLGGTSWAGDSSSILEQWTSDKLEALRNQFLNNKQPAMCNRCWHEEANNKRSLRLRLYDPENNTSDFTFGRADLIEERLSSYKNGPLVLTIKNGNICNAKCRVCHPNDSSRWIADAKKIHDITGKRYYNLDQVEMNWNDQQLNEIVMIAGNLERLELFGGEPSYNRQVSVLLDRLADAGLSKNITLYINTNGGVDITERMPAVKEFKCVEIGVSIDGVGQQFDYIRHGIKYETVIENIRRWQQYFTANAVPYSIDSISTVEILNVFYLEELRTAVKEILPLTPFWNLLVKPDHLFIKNMPDSVKVAVLDRLPDDEDFAEIRSVIAQPAELEYWNQFLEITGALDKIRGESFARTFPEFAEIISRV